MKNLTVIRAKWFFFFIILIIGTLAIAFGQSTDPVPDSPVDWYVVAAAIFAPIILLAKAIVAIWPSDKASRIIDLIEKIGNVFFSTKRAERRAIRKLRNNKPINNN